MAAYYTLHIAGLTRELKICPISEKLDISIRTVETHKNHIMKKLELKSTVDLIKFAIKNNFAEL